MPSITSTAPVPADQQSSTGLETFPPFNAASQVHPILNILLVPTHGINTQARMGRRVDPMNRRPIDTNNPCLALYPGAVRNAAERVIQATRNYAPIWEEFKRTHGRPPEKELPPATEAVLRVQTLCKQHAGQSYASALAELASICLREPPEYFTKALGNNETKFFTTAEPVPRPGNFVAMVPMHNVDGNWLQEIPVIVRPGNSLPAKGFQMRRRGSNTHAFDFVGGSTELTLCYTEAWRPATEEEIIRQFNNIFSNEERSYLINNERIDMVCPILYALFANL